MSVYSEKLKDPRWQKKRLKIMERDDWTCQHCFSHEITLNVHHKYYENEFPWDDPDEALITYCEDCHEGISLIIRTNKSIMNSIDKKQVSDFCEIILSIGEIIIRKPVELSELITAIDDIKNGRLD